MIVFHKSKTKIFIFKLTSICIGVRNMSCEYCGKSLKPFENFILVGKYPTRGQMWKWSEAKYYVKPENYGKVYHKECFLTKANEEKGKP